MTKFVADPPPFRENSLTFFIFLLNPSLSCLTLTWDLSDLEPPKTDFQTLETLTLTPYMGQFAI